MSDVDTKKINKKTYVWAHVGTIMFHTLIGILLVVLYYKDHIGKVSRQSMVLILGLILIIVSLMGLAPVLKDYKKIEIS